MAKYCTELCNHNALVVKKKVLYSSDFCLAGSGSGDDHDDYDEMQQVSGDDYYDHENDDNDEDHDDDNDDDDDDNEDKKSLSASLQRVSVDAYFISMEPFALHCSTVMLAFLRMMMMYLRSFS